MPAHPAQDALTLANNGLSLLKAGDATAASDLAEKALKEFPDHPALLQISGLAAQQLGDNKRAADALKKTLESNSEQPGLWSIYGGVLEVLNQHDEAINAYDEAIRCAPEEAAGYRQRGSALLQLHRHQDAVAAFDKAISLSPRDADVWLLKGGAHFALSDLDAAEFAFENALAIHPYWPKAIVNLGCVQVERGQRETAMEHFQRALELAPQDSDVLRQVATTLWELHLPDQAETLFKNALDISPEDTVALATLATLYEQTNRLREAKEVALKALSLDPENLQAQKVQAILERRKGDPEKALVEVKKLAERAPTDADRESLTFELARLHDRLGHTDQAYAHFKEANQLQSESPAGRRVHGHTYLQQVEREADILSNTPPIKSAVTTADGSQPDPVFLIGFPRSGTTLLDQVLDSHPDILVMDERPPLADVHERITRLEEASGRAFVQLDEEQRRVAREFYFERAERFVSDFSGKVFVDKNPLGTSKIRIIKLLFPQARIVFALRHPCDVVLSCFMQRFTLNIAMANFHTLLGAVATYESVMDLWMRSGEGLGLPVHKIRYEDVVQDFEAQAKDLLQFLNVPWDARVVDFHEHAQTRHVRTASASQVTEPLYTSALARWHRYGTYLAPHMNALRPFIESFGYDGSINGGN